MSTGRDESGGHWMTPVLRIPDDITLVCNRYHANMTERSYKYENRTVHFVHREVWWEVSCHDKAGKGTDLNNVVCSEV